MRRRAVQLTWRLACVAILGALLWTSAPAAQAQAEPYRDLICSYSWPCEEALHVARCESTMNPNAYSAGNYGLFQIAYSAHRDLVASPAALYDPEVNTAVAFELWTEQGWRPWACRP